jgi:hypothetical protein
VIWLRTVEQRVTHPHPNSRTRAQPLQHEGANARYRSHQAKDEVSYSHD